MQKTIKPSRGQLRAITLATIIKKQDGKCALCGKPIDLTKTGRNSDYAFDHDHETGLMRAVLHRSCNAAEGKVLHAASRWGAKSGAIAAGVEWVRQWLAYHDYHAANPSNMIYPDHKTDEEKAIAAKVKRQKAAAKKKADARRKEILEQRKSGATI